MLPAPNGELLAGNGDGGAAAAEVQHRRTDDS